MLPLESQVAAIRNALLEVGFLEGRLRTDVAVPDSETKAALVGFADHPLDSRTSAVAVVQANGIAESCITLLRPLGAPLVFACHPEFVEFWTQSATAPRFQSRLTTKELRTFFRTNKESLAPAAENKLLKIEGTKRIEIDAGAGHACTMG